MDGERAGVRRRLAAILFADVVGYSRMVAEDEAGALASVRALRRHNLEPRVVAHGGRLFAAMGDGFASEFPSAVEAVACAVEVQRALIAERATTDIACLCGLALRIGVNLGDVVVEPGGDVFGDGVNVAARLDALAEPGGIVISAKTFDELRGRLPYPFEDTGERTLKNIPWPVRVFALSAAAIEKLPEAEPERVDRQVRQWPQRAALVLGAGLFTAALAASTAIWWAPLPSPSTSQHPAVVDQVPLPVSPTPEPRRASLVVLPFANLSGDPEQDYLADGITDELITTLGGNAETLVIGRGTAFTYRGRAVDVRQVGQELGVRYVLEGSIRRSGERISLNVQLLDARTRGRLWADQFDVPRTDLAEVGRTVTTRIHRPLGLELVAAESSRSLAERPGNPDVQDLMLRGRVAWLRPPSPENLAEARSLFERAVALDEGSAQAHALLGGIHIDAIVKSWSSDRAADLEAGERHLARALAIDDRHLFAHHWRGVAQGLQWRFGEAIAEYDMVIALNRNFPPAYAARGATKILTDRPAEGIVDINEAMQISPRDRDFGTWFQFLGFANLMLGQDEDALAYFVRAVAASPTIHPHRLSLASAYALAGRVDEARATLREFRERYPRVTITYLRPFIVVWSPYPLWRAMQERLLVDGLRLAGLPEE
jgi:adenylate cyclase